MRQSLKLAMLFVASTSSFWSCATFTPASDLSDVSLASTNGTVVEARFSESSRLNYVLTHPDPDGEPRPIVVFLHSLEERGGEIGPVIDNPAGQGAGLAEIAATVASDHPLTEFATLSPLCPDGTYWFLLRRRLLRLIDEIAARPNIDADRVYLTGVSMGGMGVWSLGMAAPERFTALVPIAGGVYSPPMRRRFGRLADTPMWVIHDRHDPSVELERDAWAVARVREAGGSVRFTITEEGAHYVHEGFYRDSAFYDWLRTAAEVSPSGDM